MQKIGLLSLSTNEQKQFEALLKLPFTHSEKKEVLKHIEEICLRDETAAGNLFSMLKINDILNNEKLSGKEAVKQVRELLHKTRFPHLAQKEEEFAAWKKQIKLPPEISLNHAPNFEQEWLEVRFRFKNTEELKQRIKKLSEIAEFDFSSSSLQGKNE
ncbi:hypothetical protein ACFL57_05390 [Candidatus Margulisiibacteriota bacterium]